MRVFLMGCFVSLALSALMVNADDWSQWRGNNRDGEWSESGVFHEFTAEDLRPLWRKKIGTGYSSPTVVGDKVLVMDYDERKKIETVRCFNAANGEVFWEHPYKVSNYSSIKYTAGPRCAVTIADGNAFALGATGRLHCIDVDSGKVVWEKDLNEEYEIAAKRRMPIWGIASSPLVHEDVVIIQIGASEAGVIGLDKSDGKEIWKALDDRGHYSSPVMVRQNDQDVAVCWTGAGVAGLDPKKGTVHWYHQFRPKRMPIGVATPVINGRKIFLTSFYDGSMMLEMSETEMAVKELWHLVGPNERPGSTKALHSIISTPTWIEDHIYGVDSYGELRCLRAADGERVWEDLTAVKKSRWATIHFVSQGDMTWMLNEQGELMVGKLSPEGLELTSRASVLEANQMRQPNRQGGVCWSHPAFANKCVYLRNDNELICIKLSK